VRDHEIDFFSRAPQLWRISVKPTTAPLPLDGAQLIEWSGALRWLAADADPARVRAAASAAGGHATLFRRGGSTAEVFHPLQPALLRIHQRLKQTFDPRGILNPGRLYPEF
jgi:glycolate oxidase FAD binding subunit